MREHQVGHVFFLKSGEFDEKNMMKSIKECGFGPKSHYENRGSILPLEENPILSDSEPVGP